MKKLKLLAAPMLVLVVAGSIFFIPERKMKLETPHFVFHYSTGIDTASIDALATGLEQHYIRISNELKTAPSPRITVNIYNQRWRYIQATGNWGASGSIEGISKLHFIAQAWGNDDTKKVAVHEFTHIVTLKLLLDHEPPPVDAGFDKKFSTFPVWLWEGIAVYEAGEFVDPKTLPYLQQNRHPNLDELNSRLKGGKIYTCGYTLVEYILFQYGQDGLIRLVLNYGDVNKTFDVTPEHFSKSWYHFIQQKYLLQK